MLVLLLVLCPDGLRQLPGGGEEGPPESPDDTATSPFRPTGLRQFIGRYLLDSWPAQSYNDLFDRTKVSQMPTGSGGQSLSQRGRNGAIPWSWATALTAIWARDLGGSARITPCG